ncbi:hypothetical protein D9M68_985930 [compost metagenome]
MPEEEVESHGQRNPYRAPESRLLKFHNMLFLFTERAQIKQHHKNGKQGKPAKKYNLVR